MDNKRKQDRIPAEIKAEVNSDDGFTFSTTVNVSEGGIFISTPEPHKPGTQLTVTIIAGDREFECKAIVRWTREDDSDDVKAGMGVEFLDVAEEDIKELQSFLQ